METSLHLNSCCSTATESIEYDGFSWALGAGITESCGAEAHQTSYIQKAQQGGRYLCGNL